MTCPTVVISGSEDRVIPSMLALRIAQKYKAVSTYKEFPGHSHWLIKERGWEEVANYAKEWLGATLGT